MARAAGPAAPGSKAIPDGEPGCLAGLSFVFTGELQSLARDEAVDLAKRFGGRVVGQPSGVTSYVVVGDNAGPSKIAAIKKHGLKMISEDEFLNLIATRKSKSVDTKTKAKMAKEEENLRKAAEEMERAEKKAEKERAKAALNAAAHGSPVKKPPVDTRSQLWTTRYAPQNLKEICGNKGQVEKLQGWLNDWCGFYRMSHNAVVNKVEFQVFKLEIRVQETWQERHEHIPRCVNDWAAWNRKNDECAFVCEASWIHAD